MNAGNDAAFDRHTMQAVRPVISPSVTASLKLPKTKPSDNGAKAIVPQMRRVKRKSTCSLALLAVVGRTN
jgi:hypothetical protein